MNTGTTIGIMITLLGIILTIVYRMNDSIDKRLESMINDPKFIKKVADDIRLPFLIFDEKGTFHTESGGATAYIEKIEPVYEENRFSGFVVYPKILLKEAPILQSINNDFQFTLPKPINTFDWRYRIPKFEGNSWVNSGDFDEAPAKQFKLEIIRQPE